MSPDQNLGSSARCLPDHRCVLSLGFLGKGEYLIGGGVNLVTSRQASERFHRVGREDRSKSPTTSWDSILDRTMFESPGPPDDQLSHYEDVSPDISPVAVPVFRLVMCHADGFWGECLWIVHLYRDARG